MSNAQSNLADNSRLCAELGDCTAPDRVLADPVSIDLYSQDIYSSGEPVAAVVQPLDVDELSRVMQAAARGGYAVIARGGGMSYTAGYLATRPETLLLDLSRMNRVLEVNTEDMYVTVQSGCTWQDLDNALSDSGLRTPYWGTLSGITATVGGGLSQNSIFWGSGQYGSCVDSVLSLELVLADGRIIRTGSAAHSNGLPFFRHFGPDLTGLFTCDNGALAIKAAATLKLIPRLKARRYASYDFDDFPNLIAAMSQVARENLAMENFAFDPTLQRQRMARESLASDVRKLAGVMKASGSVVGAIRDGIKVATAGRGFMDDAHYSLHLIVEERSEGAADECIARIDTLCTENGGRLLEDSIPKILRANPFTPLNNVLGSQGERWAPVHALLPHSRAQDVTRRIDQLIKDQAELIERHQIQVGYLYATVSTHCFVLEPVFFWPDEMRELHARTVQPQVLERLQRFEADPEARAAVDGLRKSMIEIFRQAGAAHLQVGKTYPLRDGLAPDSWQLLQAIKQSVDPDGRINPGCLGLD